MIQEIKTTLTGELYHVRIMVIVCKKNREIMGYNNET